MTSQSRLEANRAIAKRSTGPRTELGKARSKMNAVKHGLSAKAIVLEGEDRCERRQILQRCAVLAKLLWP